MSKQTQYMPIENLLGYTKEQLEDLVKNKNNYYYSYFIKKRGGRRRAIDAPEGELKRVQSLITKKILYKFGPHPIACGFAKKRNQIDAAQKHVGKEVLLSLDIKNFFNSIKEHQVDELFNYLHRKYYGQLSFRLAWEKKILVELLTYRGMVPQGAPSSPALSNLYMLRVDMQLKKLACTFNADVTRYADDITFSGNFSKEDISDIITRVRSILGSYGLRLNNRKIRVRRRHKRMQVVGIVVNEKLNIKREVWRNFRAELHNLKMSQEYVSKEKAQVLRGKIEWFKNLNLQRGMQFLEEFGQLNFSKESDTLEKTTT